LTGGVGPDDLENVETLPVHCFEGIPSDAPAFLLALEAVLSGQPARIHRRGTAPRRILIVDDNAINLFLARDFLKGMEGVEVVTAEGGQLGLTLALGEEFDIILMDMQMPVIDGQTATREIRKHEAANAITPTPIVAFTAHSLPSELEAARLAGCDGYLIKPAKRELMISTVLSFIQPAEPTPVAPAAKIRAEGNERFRSHMAGYLLKLAESLQQAETALAEGDFKTVREIAHKWIGPSASLGIPELSDEGGLLQDAARCEQEPNVRRKLGQTREYAHRLQIIYPNGDSLTPPLTEFGELVATAPTEKTP
jgi:CheY-like chemotaxis protein